MLYTLLADSNKYLGAVIDSDYVESVVGSLRGERRDDRIDLNHQPRSWKDVFPGPLKITFPLFNAADGQKTIPDIAEFQGRLFLSPKAYIILKPLIEKDGEFLAGVYQDGECFIFTPLRIAEDVDGLDLVLSRKNEWGDVDNIAFHEERVKEWALFRSNYTAYMRLYCQGSLKDAIEAAKLTGLYFTPDLSNIFPEERSSVTQIN